MTVQTICSAGPYNRCGVSALSSRRDRSGRPSVRPAPAAAGRRHRRAVVSPAACGRGGVRGRAARGHLAGGPGRRHAYRPDHGVLGLAVADRRPGTRRRHRPACGGRCLLPFPVPQLRAARRCSRRCAPGGHARQARRRRRAGCARGGVGEAMRSGHPGRGDRRSAAGAALAGPARAAVRAGGRRRHSRVRRACPARHRPPRAVRVAAAPRRPGRRRRPAFLPAGTRRVAKAHAGLGACRRRAHGHVRLRGPGRRLHRTPGRTGRAADGGADRGGDPVEYRRVGATGGHCRLGLRRGRARRGYRGHGHHPLCGAHAGRGRPGRGAAAEGRRSPPSRPWTPGRAERTRSGAADDGGRSWLIRASGSSRDRGGPGGSGPPAYSHPAALG